MKNAHIFDILDEKSFADFSASEIDFIQSHTKNCPACDTAFRAARVSSVLLKTEAEDFSPSPFFAARLTANLRENRAPLNPFAALVKLWRASSAMVLLMIFFVGGLLALTFAAPDFNDVSNGINNSSAEIYSTDMIIAGEKNLGKEPTNEQVFRIIYASEGITKK